MDDARVSVRTLSVLHQLRKHFPSTPITDFYIDALNDEYMISPENRTLEFKFWMYDETAYENAVHQYRHHHHQPTNRSKDINPNHIFITKKSFISFPFSLSPATKAIILEMDATIQMRQEINNEVSHAYASGAQYIMPYLILRVRRDCIIQDTLSQMLGFDDGDFKKPLKVVFDGEDGVDAGGVRKEFYQVYLYTVG